MPPPQIPNDVDGLPLDQRQRQVLTDLVNLIYSRNPTRAPAATLNQAVDGWRMMHKRFKGAWTARRVFRLGNGNGPAVVNKSAQPPQ